MPIDIERQSRELAIDIKDLFDDMMNENNKLIKLNIKLLEKQLSDNPTEDNEEVINYHTYEKSEEIKKCEDNIQNDIRKSKDALLNIIDLIFIAINEINGELEDKINDTYDEFEYQISDIDDRLEEIET